MRININGKIIESVDCQSWSLDVDQPFCHKGLDVAGCGTCPMRVERTKAPPAKMLQKAASWVKAEASRFTQELAEGQYEARLATCRACEFLNPRDEPQVGFCKACGCGESARAELTIKGKMPAATCPKGKWPVAP